jgi:hypothetical protein
MRSLSYIRPCLYRWTLSVMRYLPRGWILRARHLKTCRWVESHSGGLFRMTFLGLREAVVRSDMVSIYRSVAVVC